MKRMQLQISSKLNENLEDFYSSIQMIEKMIHR